MNASSTALVCVWLFVLRRVVKVGQTGERTGSSTELNSTTVVQDHHHHQARDGLEQ